MVAAVAVAVAAERRSSTTGASWQSPKPSGVEQQVDVVAADREPLVADARARARPPARASLRHTAQPGPVRARLADSRCCGERIGVDDRPAVARRVRRRTARRRCTRRSARTRWRSCGCRRRRRCRNCVAPARRSRGRTSAPTPRAARRSRACGRVQDRTAQTGARPRARGRPTAGRAAERRRERVPAPPRTDAVGTSRHGSAQPRATASRPAQALAPRPARRLTWPPASRCRCRASTASGGSSSNAPAISREASSRTVLGLLGRALEQQLVVDLEHQPRRRPASRERARRSGPSRPS